jgi:hypothetical protein
MENQNKLECFVPKFTFLPNSIFAVDTRILGQMEAAKRDSTWVGSRLAHKY